MKWKQVDSSDLNKISVIFETKGSGYIVAEETPLKQLAAFLGAAGIRVSVSLATPSGLARGNFICFEKPLRDAIEKWPAFSAHEVEYQSPA